MMTWEKNVFSPLKAFHDIGTRGIFYYKAEHRDGFSVRLSACHCPYCIRGYHANGIMRTAMLAYKDRNY
jgi:hypothetical protein